VSVSAGFVLGILFRVKKDGKETTVAVELYGKSDEAPPAKSKAENKTVKKAEDQPVATSEAEGGQPSGGPRTVAVDWSQSQAVLLVPSEPEWRVTPPSAPAADFHPKTVSLPPKLDFFESLSGMAVSRAAKAAVIGYGLRKPGETEDPTTRLLRCDLQSGRVTDSGTMEGELAPIALDNDGRQVLLRSNEFGYGKQDRLEIWTLEGKKATRTLVWTPFAGKGKHERNSDHDVTWAEFLNADKLATCSRSGKFAIWSLATGQPVCHFQIGDGAIPDLSPDRKWIAFAGSDTIGLFDVEKQELIAAEETPCKLHWPRVAFSPSGRKIGCAALDRILVWDTASGKLEKNFTLAGISLSGELSFPDEGYLLGGNQYLIELENQLKLWHYQGAERTCVIGDTTLFATIDADGPGVLLAVKVPHPEALSLLKKALTEPDLFVFRKGTPVKLDVSGIPDAERQESVKETLTQKLQEMDCALDPAAKVEVVASVEGPKTREVPYIPRNTYKFKEYLSRLRIVYQGRTAWEISTTNIPPMMGMSPFGPNNIPPFGPHNMDAQREDGQKPSYEIFERTALPDFVQKPSASTKAGASQTLGTSRVTPHGFRAF
jgi:hypothetical protein